MINGVNYALQANAQTTDRTRFANVILAANTVAK
jgi:hypothetical protein